LPASGKRILVVEDDPGVRDALAAVLVLEGHTVTTAENGVEALALLPGTPPFAVILLDLMMPIMDGFTFLSERARNPRVAAIPVIVMSAFEPRPPDGPPLDVPYVRKPIDVDHLLALIVEQQR
jgi:CheY-like chemotaxis protein